MLLCCLYCLSTTDLGPGIETRLHREDMIEMMSLLDADGNQDVSKAEFKEYCRTANIVTDPGEFEEMWKLIDDNGDGVMQFSELCTYFGVDVDGAEEGAKQRKEMSDEQIFQMLDVSSKMYEEKQRVKREQEEMFKSKRRNSREHKNGVKSIKSVGADKETDEFKLLDSCDMLEDTDEPTCKELLGFIVPDKDSTASFDAPKWVPPNQVACNVRIERADTADTPLHKLARNLKYNLIKRVHEILLSSNPPDTVKADINAQNKEGKTPLMLAVEGRQDIVNKIQKDAAKWKAYQDAQVMTVSLLLGFGADMYMEAANGWNIIHCAAHGGNVMAAKEIFGYMDKNGFSTLKTKLVVDHKDKDGRTPLHIAAMRADMDVEKPPFLQLLLNKGSDPEARDNGAKLTPSLLAEKAGRRYSKEMLVEAEKDKQEQTKVYRQRRSSLSREIPDYPQSGGDA